jgi:hypothetical protein
MKKLFCHFLVIFSFISCQEEIKFNNPSFQGVKDNVFWRAVSYNATRSNSGVLTIEAYTRNEIVTLKTSATTVGVYQLGSSTSNTASYKITNKTASTLFSTGSDFGDGEIAITNYDAVNKTVTGTFKFNVENIDNDPLFGPSINFQNGNFYKIPIN